MAKKYHVKDNLLLAASFLWATAESIIFFVLPDFFLIPAIVARPHLAKKLVLASIAGSALGTIILISVALASITFARSIVESALLITPAMFDKVPESLAQGPMAVLMQPFSGIPVKVWSWSVVATGYSVPAYFILVMIGRSIRMAAVASVAFGANRLFAKRLYKFRYILLGVYVLAFLIVLPLVAGSV